MFSRILKDLREAAQEKQSDVPKRSLCPRPPSHNMNMVVPCPAEALWRHWQSTLMLQQITFLVSPPIPIWKKP